MRQSQRIRIEIDGPVQWVIIDRPEVLNALDPPTHRELSAAFDAFAADAERHVAVITGAGERAFCVGSDIKWRAATNVDEYPATGYAGLTHRFDLSKPVIAAVNGMALGGGAEIIAACDLAYAAEHATFAFPEPRLGLAALGGGGLQRLARHLPMKHAMDIFLTGRRFGAAEAKALALINDVVPPAHLRAHVQEVAMIIAANAPLAIQASKEVIRRSADVADLSEALAKDYPAACRMLASEDAVEGQRAFVEKRAPVWRGR